MKYKKSLAVILGSAVFTALLAVGISIAWLSPTAYMRNSENPIEGMVQDKYYNSGDGITYETAFEITQPRHLYNLAWLQYLGFYNKSEGIDNHQFYFKLGNNIDMSQFGPIPPIGTESNPFVGNFDGHGYVISGVTISNDFNDYISHPSAIEGWDNSTKKQPHILGLFGVVGEYPGGNNSTNYDTEVNEFVNTAVTNATIKTVVNDSLIGIVAGCVYDGDLTDTHDVLKNIAVDSSKIDVSGPGASAYYDNTLTTNISDYTLVGYTNNISTAVKASKSVYGINIDTNITYAATEEGNYAGWGGSIDMLSMYNQLHDIWNKLNHSYASNPTIDPIKYYANKEITIEKNGSTTINSQTNATANSMTSSTDSTVSSSTTTYKYFSTSTSDTDSKQTSSYSFVVGNAGKSTEERFMCLTGGKTVERSNSQTLKTNYYDVFYGQKIYKTISGVAYYLKADGTNDVTVSSESEASLWKIDGTSIYTSINDTIYYLNRSGTSTVIISTSSNTEWHYDETFGSYYVTVSNKNYYLNCATSDWNLVSTVVDHVLLHDNQGHYIAHPSTNNSDEDASTSSDPTSTTTWWYQDGDYFKSSSSGDARYLRNNVTSSQSSTVYSHMQVGSTNSNRFFVNNGYLYTTYRANNTTHYVYGYYYSDISEWVEIISRYTNHNYKTSIIVEEISTLVDSAKNISLSAVSETPLYEKKSRTDTVAASFNVEHTYFPLRSEDGKPGVPAETNTGYVVSGGNYSADEFGDIRVSSYPKSTYLPNGVNTVYTINASGQSVAVNASDYTKYDAAKTSMQTVLSGKTDVYGLHFMNASINYGGTNRAIVEKAIVNGVTHSNYELPTDCIDFNLKEKGFINFFAGSYYTNNNCFFSLNEVVRSGSSISSIREIKAIYHDLSDTGDVQSYIYQYGDNSYSVPFKYTNGVKTKLDGTAYTPYSTQNSKPNSYTLAFDTFRITNRANNSFSLTTNSAYYFEIPMNEGEYCLGSVSGRNGAYLMYLDIAANASKVNRTVVYEKFTVDESTYEYPSGVCLQSLGSSYSSTTVVISTDLDASDSACMKIIPNASGIFEIDRNGNDVQLSRAQTANAPPVYSGDSITKVHEKESETNIAIAPISPTTTSIIKRMVYYDYMIISDTTVVTTFTDTSTDGGTNYTRTIKQEIYGGTDLTAAPRNTYIYDGTTDNRSSMKIYRHDPSNKGKRVSNADMINQNVISISDGKLNGTPILIFRLFQDGGSYTEDFDVVVMLDSSLNSRGTFFTYNGFTITITPDGSNIVITTTGYGSSFSMSVTSVDATNSPTTTSSQTTSISINGTPITGTDQRITIS